MKIRCLIAEDEPLALKLTKDYVARIPHLELIGSCKQATDVPGLISRVDLLFLDIRMPGITGLELLRSLPVKPLVILITAYSEHAVEGFELNVVDYLVKPVTFERFLQAVNKATRQFDLQQSSTAPSFAASEAEVIREPDNKDYFFVKSGFKSVRINFEDILYVEGLKEYVSIYTSGDKKFVKLAALKELERILPRGKFLRIHKSYIVAVNKVTAAYGNTVELKQVSLPIGRIYKEEVMKILS
ncbi:MAG: LytTR family DNA-binding domain-containing protein [Bacteroidales bacterium]|nr:LytTR family DNA-binding domain-containing protein [Bacteroidales bacterium]